MKIGVCHWSIPLEGPAAMDILGDLNLKGIQIDLGSYERGFQLSWPSVQEKYKEYAKKNDITFTSLAVRELDLHGMTRPDGTKEKDIVIEAILKAISVAEQMDIPVVMLPSFLDGEIKTEEDFQRVVKCLKFACDKCEGSEVIIATENLLSIEENKRLFKEVDRQNLKLYFDTQNYYLNKKYNTAEMVKELYPYICEVHVKDGNNALSGALLGQGDTNFFETIKVLIEKNYTGWVHLENYYDQKPLSNLGEDPLALLKQDVEILKSTIS
ncbi:sugar phosphate isomerase/epimerase family protein [Peribacillus sp. NPDC058075]|uniref:sugar phosphate isomerase/epimerase family protein n=1 Tax=unclassified Peribacillus TaxID=2675266 RepID=UPI0036DBFEC1